jgi:uncharacterized protein YjbI with pentapeptide repeats
MADLLHLALLKQGVDVWNTWRMQNPTIQPDLRGAILCSVWLSKANLSRANLSGAYLYGAYLFSADLSEANLSRANLSKAYLYASNLSEANLKGAILNGSDLSNANFNGADFKGANLCGVNLSDEGNLRSRGRASRRPCSTGSQGRREARPLQRRSSLIEWDRSLTPVSQRYRIVAMPSKTLL